MITAGRRASGSDARWRWIAVPMATSAHCTSGVAMAQAISMSGSNDDRLLVA